MQRRMTVLLSSTALVGGALLITSPARAQSVPTPSPYQYGPALIGAPTAWSMGFTGAGVTVAVAEPALTRRIRPSLEKSIRAA
jgi:hypothetical protein